MATTGTTDRVLIEVAPATLTELGVGVEEVRRESLTRTIDAVATIAPDESRVSHVHTRVAGWIEHLDISPDGRRIAYFRGLLESEIVLLKPKTE